MRLVAGPRQSDRYGVACSDAITPSGDVQRRSRDIGYRRRNGLDRRSERQRQAQEGAMTVEWGKRIASRANGRRPGKASQQRHQRPLNLDYHLGGLPGDHWQKSDELQRATYSLIGMQQNGLAAQALGAQPQRLGKISAKRSCVLPQPTPFVLSPAVIEVTDSQVLETFVILHFGKAGFVSQRLSVARDRRCRAIQRNQRPRKIA